MDPVQAPGVYKGAANVIAAVMLLLEFGMLHQALVRDQIRLQFIRGAKRLGRRLDAVAELLELRDARQCPRDPGIRQISSTLM